MLEAPRVYAEPSAGSGDRPDLVVVGAASRDVTSDDSRGWRVGGPATYCSLAAARLGVRVGCLLGVDAAASRAPELLLLEQAGVDLRRIPLQSGPVFENIERDGHRRQRWLSKSGAMKVADLPDEWRGSRAWLLVPVAGELGEDWADVPDEGSAVGLGWQGMLREFAEGGWVERVDPEPSELLRAAGLVCASVDDLAPLWELERLRPLAPRAIIVLTAGDRGGVVLRDGDVARYRAITANRNVDPTGAGDVFLAGLMAVWLLTGEPVTSRALRFAAAASSCAIEGAGLTGVPTGAQVATRLRARDAAGLRDGT